MNWDKQVEVLVVGSGNGALTAAICSHNMGKKNILVLEKADKFGGTSGISGGGIWIPNNDQAKQLGLSDSPAAAKQYLSETIASDDVSNELIDTYIANAPKMLRYIENHSRAKYNPVVQYPDYYMDKPGAMAGGRSLEPEPIMRSELGANSKHLQETHHMMHLFDRISFTQVEAHTLMTREAGWQKLFAKLVWRHISDLPWLIKNKRSRRLACGAAGTSRLFLSLKDRGIPVWFKSPVTRLITNEQGDVVGAQIKQNGQTLRIKAESIILAAGGFEHNQAMREQYLPKPSNSQWSGGVKTNTGDLIQQAQAIGAKTHLMDGAWWCTTISAPDEQAPRLAIMEKSLPGSCVVNLAGKRIANESQNYMAYQTELFASHSESNPNAPAYMIFDRKFRQNYIVGPLLDNTTRPDWRIPKQYYQNQFFTKANSIDALATQLGIDNTQLEQTVSRLNQFSKTGKDLDFQRGDSEYDRYYGDESVTPNPCLGSIEQAPFYGIKIDPGDFGTHGGLAINTHAQVLNEKNTVIKGLYAIGNNATAILPSYPGPGSTLGPAMTFAYQAAKHICQYQD